jgi:hypothetical protein
MPVLGVQRRRFLARGYWVVATWPGGRRMDVVRFTHAFAAEYWIKVEGANWIARNNGTALAA